MNKKQLIAKLDGSLNKNKAEADPTYDTINKNILDVKKFPQIDLIFYLIKANNIKQSKKYFIKFKNLLGMLKTKPKILYFSSGAVSGNIHKKSETKESITTPNKNINYKQNETFFKHR